jgi:alpha-glucosidase (family GH31 glycosyl hydrolase)
MNSFPLFARGGYPILMQPYTERMTSSPLENVVVRYYPGKTGQTESTSLYEDDGETRDYLQGGYSTTQITTSQDSQQLTVKIAPQKNRDLFPSYRPMTRTYEIQFMASKQVQSAEVNGAAASVTFDPKLGVNHIGAPLTPSDQLITVTVGLPPGSL